MHCWEFWYPHLILIDIRVQELLVAAVDDSGAVTGSKDVGNAIAVEGLEGDGLAAQAQLLPLAQLPCIGTGACCVLLCDVCRHRIQRQLCFPSSCHNWADTGMPSRQQQDIRLQRCMDHVKPT